MKYILIMLMLIGCTPDGKHIETKPVPAAQQGHHKQHGHSGGHEAPSRSTVASMTSQRIETLKMAELSYQLALLAYGNLPGLEGLHYEARLYDGLVDFRTKGQPSEDEFVAAMYYYNYATKELLDYVREQKAAK